MHPSDANIPVSDSIYDDQSGCYHQVELWRVFGIDGYFPTKIVAEEAARLRFPNEDPNRRYNRVSYTKFTSDRSMKSWE